jgi:FkbM family methyltransferase
MTDASHRQFHREVTRFFRERGHHTPSDFEGLAHDSILFDIGGYRGEWTALMRSKYDCHVHVFEPHPEFVELISHRFSEDGKVSVHPYALGSSEDVLMLSDAADGSSAFSKGNPSIQGRIRNATEVLAEIGADKIAVAKINIEGGEFELLQYLIETGAIKKFRTITVQFHNFVPNAVAQRDQIRVDLAKTHRCVWNYDFVWEEWTRLNPT